MRADRLLSIVMLLRHHGRMTATALAIELEVSERTILRDIDALSTSGVPVYADRGRNGGFSLLPGFRTDLTGLTLDEAKALMASASGRVSSPSFASAMRKVAAALPEPHREAATSAAQRILVRPDGFIRSAPEEKELAQLQYAVIEGRRLRVRYHRFGGQPATRLLDPIGLIFGGERWYLAALRDNVERIYRVSRISDVTVLDEPARRPATVDLDAMWTDRRTEFRSAFTGITVTCEFRQSRLAGLTTVARRVGTPTELPDGWLRADLEFVDAKHAIRIMWTLADDAVVLAPDTVRDAIAERVKAMTRGYA